MPRCYDPGAQLHVDPKSVAARVTRGDPRRAWTAECAAAAGPNDVLTLAGSLSHTHPIENTARVRAVYTPTAQRGRGYASACVGSLSENLVTRGLRRILYTDLANPTSNAIYRRLGYHAVGELVRYRFVTDASPTG